MIEKKLRSGDIHFPLKIRVFTQKSPLFKKTSTTKKISVLLRGFVYNFAITHSK